MVIARQVKIMSEKQNDAQMDTEKQFFERQLVVFMIGAEEFGVDINDVREIIKMEDVTVIPGTDDYILGVINLRGKIIVVIDLAKKVGLEVKEKDKNTRVLVTEIEGNTIGMVVDNCNEVLRITGDKIEPAPSTITQKINADYIQGVGVLDKRLLILVDLGKVIESKDIEHITHVTEQQSGNAETGDAGKTKDTAKYAGAKKKVLIVDDSTMMRGTIKSYIDTSKYDILEAADGEQAVAKVKSEEPAIVLLDIKMPNLDGIGALKKIKEIKPKTIVIMETSVYEEETKKQCIDLGAADYLKKPISKKQLEDALKTA